MRRRALPILAVACLLASPLALAGAEDEVPAKQAGVTFDRTNVPLDQVLERAKEAKKLVFLDFFLPG